MACALSYELLPGTQEIEALKRCGEVPLILKAAPDGLGLAEFVKYFNS